MKILIWGIAAIFTVFFWSLWILNIEVAFLGVDFVENLAVQFVPTAMEYLLWVKYLYKTDMSTITTALLWWFSLCICYEAFHIPKNSKSTPLPSLTYPFAENFSTKLIQLGLLGTLIGFLIMGMGLENPVEQEQNPYKLLRQAFGTSLLSTFTAVCLAYIAIPLVQQVFARFFAPYQPPLPLVEKKFVDLIDTVNRLTDSLDELKTSTSSLKETIKEEQKGKELIEVVDIVIKALNHWREEKERGSK